MVESYKKTSFDQWYASYDGVTFESEILPLPKDFLDYMGEDGIIMGEGSDRAFAGQEDDAMSSSSSSSDSEGDDRSTASSTTTRTKKPSEFAVRFPELKKQIEEKIEKLGGKIFPKMNWSSPQDAAFVARGRTLECRAPDEIILLLKSSDFISHDVEKLEKYSDIAPILVLRKFHPNLKKCNEWRCFIRDNKIVGISQRDINSCYASFLEKEKTKREIIKFFEDNIKINLFDNKVVIDVIKRGQETWQIVDFNTWCEDTESLLFDWEELENSNSSSSGSTAENFDPEIRIVNSESEKRLYSSDKYTAFPVELVEFFSGNKDPKEAMEMIARIEQGQKLEEDQKKNEDAE